MLGDAKQKLQRMVDLAEDLYASVNDLKQRVEETTATVEETNERVSDLEAEVRAQRVILEAVAEDHGLDVELPAEFASGEDADTAEEATPSSGQGQGD